MINKPNILIMIPHDLGDYLNCYGHASVQSPNLDRMSAEGVRFTNIFTTCPECTASRGGFYSGYQPHQNGLMGLAGFGWEYNRETPHIAKRLRDSGYETYLFGFQHESHGTDEHVGATLGYKHVRREGNAAVETVCGHLNDFIEHEASNSTGPWFACAGFHHTHRQWPKNRNFDPATVEIPDYLPDTPIVREDMAQFHQSIFDMDAATGSVLDTLRRLNMQDNTLVIFTTDHGSPFPHAKATFYDPGVRIPLLMWGPAFIRAGTEIDELISNLDMAPTLMDLVGLDRPGNMPARSFLPLLKGEPYEKRDYVSGSLFYDVAYDPMHYVRTEKYKYIRSFAVTAEDCQGIDSEVLACFAGGKDVRVDDFDVLTSPTWQEMQRQITPAMPEREELYCLENDPFELKNLAAAPAASGELAKMRGLLREMMQETSSPLLKGHVPAPAKQLQASRSYKYAGEKFMKTVANRRIIL